MARVGDDSARSSKAGVPVRRSELHLHRRQDHDGARHALPDARGIRAAAPTRSMFNVLEEERDKNGELTQAKVFDARATSRATPRWSTASSAARSAGSRTSSCSTTRRTTPIASGKDRAEIDDEIVVRRRAEDDEFVRGGDGLGRGARPHPQAARHQLLRRPLGDAVLPRPRRAGHEPAVSVGRERLRADRRDRDRAGEDSAARRAATRPGAERAILQHLGLDLPKLTPAEKGRGQDGSEARGDPEVCGARRSRCWAG